MKQWVQKQVADASPFLNRCLGDILNNKITMLTFYNAWVDVSASVEIYWYILSFGNKQMKYDLR